MATEFMAMTEQMPCENEQACPKMHGELRQKPQLGLTTKAQRHEGKPV
jgi:hypothetical protein